MTRNSAQPINATRAPASRTAPGRVNSLSAAPTRYNRCEGPSDTRWPTTTANRKPLIINNLGNTKQCKSLIINTLPHPYGRELLLYIASRAGYRGGFLAHDHLIFFQPDYDRSQL